MCSDNARSEVSTHPVYVEGRKNNKYYGGGARCMRAVGTPPTRNLRVKGKE